MKRLENFNSGKVDKKLIERALKLADGNARLLEWLDNEVLVCEDIEGKLSQLECSSEDWQGKIIWSELYAQIDKKIVRVLSHCLVFEIPVPMSALEAVCESIYGAQEQLNRSIDLGLIEVSSEVEESERLYRVSRILLRIISSIKLPEVPEVYSLYEKGSEKLFELWDTRYNESEEKWREIFRLKFANKKNPERFRQGFSQMLESGERHEADKTFESELRQNKTELPEDSLCVQLEEYMCQGEWRKADEETLFIFYQVMAFKDIEKHNIYDEIPLSILREIDQLWVKYSDGKFGFSVHKKIYQSVGGRKKYDEEVWEAFGNEVGWRQGGEWLYWDDLTYRLDTHCVGTLPSDIAGVCSEVWVVPESGVWVLLAQRLVDFKHISVSAVNRKNF
ncbi:GUN4 domain-containing protein [Okeania sp. SIO2C2]|uniref:GUN4 domain-containing protein n=1 Tax=Okeania sp. SIO2C2 TaxID=2607787 RepID=UPI00257E7177|nr:GUN4 domain-containing protein [Okeania sp. SIO2C2]